MGALRIEVEENGRSFGCQQQEWFVAVFGRDSIIASLQAMAVSYEFGRGTLVKLAQLQATEVDDWRDAQPGKILHEIRQGELAQLHEIPHTPYGTVEATILWIITLAEAYRWNTDFSMLNDCQVPLERAWIDQYGDFDGDGFVEYVTRSQQGLRNQGWKDSGDSIVYPDGSLTRLLPSVKSRATSMMPGNGQLKFMRSGIRAIAQKLRSKAHDLYQRFNDYFG